MNLTDQIPTFPDYTATERLHVGARSTVYRGRRLSDGASVIMKVANAGRATFGESLALLRRELDLLAQIQSDRVIRGIAVSTFGTDAMLVTEDFGGESLDRYLARGRLSLADSLGLSIGVIAALRDVHAVGIIHRDITPGNIVFNAATGETRLIDFDIATAWRTSHHGFVSPRALEGTLRYMAPEQTGRMNRVTDSRADLYAFGVTLFEMLTGRLPFADADTLSIVHAHLAVRPPTPHSIDPTIPLPISAIVMKLLAKAPEDRYQTADGLLVDLQTCLERLTQTGRIDDFALCAQDVPKSFELPTKLYGRTEELHVLMRAFERSAAGAAETVLIAGPSGVGKTSLVRELFPLITRQRGYFLSGKFDQLRSEAPYPALVAAFDDLTHQLLTETEDELSRWRAAIAAAIAPNGQLVVDAIPALEQIIGPQPPVVALDAAATLERFRATLQKLIQVFTRRAHPLVLFLDDVQWADAESIQLLKRVAQSEATESFLLIEAYRDNEVSASHPLRVAARELGKQRRVIELQLAPLPASQIAALIADTLHRDDEAIAPLARLVCRKTDGNPFFVRQLLIALHDAGHIVFDPELRRFTFDAASIEHAPISENVADLLAASLRKLSPSTQRVLALAAAIGNRFDLDILAVVAGLSPSELHAELSPALDHELIVPLSDLEYVTAATGSGLGFRRLRFQHDRIQRAAYTLIEPDDQPRTHLQIGELLLANVTSTELGDRIFDIVSHLNRAIALIDAPGARTRLARLDVMAARKARGSAAYGTAVDCLRVATQAFRWDTDYQEQLETHVMLAECLYHSGEPRAALAVVDDASAQARHNHDRATLDALRATFSIHANELRAAIRYIRRAAALLGLEIPENADQLRRLTAALIAEIMQRIGARPVSELLGLPAMYAPSQRALMKLLRSCTPAAFQAEPVLAGFCTAQMVLTSLEHGNAPESPQAYCSFGGMLINSDVHHFALPLAEFALELDRRQGDRVISTTVSFIFALTVSPWFHPLDEAVRYMRQAYRLAREVGDPVVAGNAASQEISLRVMHGAEPLADILHDARALRQHGAEIGNTVSVRLLTWEIDRLRVLMGDLESLAAEEPDSRSSMLVVREEANETHQFLLLNILVDLAYTNGDPATAVELATATRLLEPSVSRMVVVAEHRFNHCLAAIAQLRKRPAMRAELEPVIEANQVFFARLAEESPATFAAMYLTIEAERAALDGRLGAAIELFDQAMVAAGRHGRRRLEAIAGELYGRMWLDRGKAEIAQLYLSRARSVYVALGAHRKVRQLDRQHRGLARGAPQSRLSGTVTSNTAAEILDVTTVAKATRAISGELELDKLLSIMLEIIFENAGAEGGALVRELPEGLVVAASRASGSSTISAVSQPLASVALPRSLIHYVVRTATTVVLDDATEDLRFGNDDDIRTRRPRSVLCMPVKHKDRLVAVLYLENTLVSGAFTPARLDALMILGSQIAVSLENAELFAAQRVQAEEISRANAELRRQIAVRERAELELAGYRIHLEDLIAERTEELTLANQKLRDAAADRERIEADLRLAQKLESVGRLSAGIAHEINTPVQYVSDSLTFLREMLPSLIDTIGHYRALATTVEDCIADYNKFRAVYASYEAAAGDVAIVNRDRLDAALDRARAAEAEADVDYALDNAPGSITAALDGLGRVAAIVRSMKDFAHPDRDEKTLVDLNRAIESTLMIAANECKYVANVHTDLAPLPLVRCNGGEINQAVLNLVINAAHAIRDVVGQSGDKGTITVRSRHDGPEIEIAISDTGTGIPPAIRDKIYDPFFTTKEVGRGTGQGLAIVRGVIVDKHGGTLKFDTEAGAGTTFYIRLPVGDALESAA